jgi:ABC-type polysaccharide/polyol phosphate transport system ATPase subunit
MNLHTVFDTSKKIGQSEPIVIAQGVSVRYRVPHERINSFKEYTIRWIKRDIRYHEFWALENIDLTLYPGEVIGIIGPNGAGKSTLLKVVSRVLRPTTGRIQVRGSLAPLLELGAGFDPELTGRENIYLNGTMLGFSKLEIDRLYDSIVEFSGLSEFIDAPLRTYSTGMFARLGFSVATVVRPDILIVDEILGVGDTEFQMKSFERIQSFQADGTTILLVSHSLEKVEEMCSLAIWLDHGKVIATGSAKTVVNQYLGRTVDIESERLAKETNLAPNQRWGSQKIKITHVRIVDRHGTEQTVFRTGEKLIVQIEYLAHERSHLPIFGIAIHRQDGMHVTGPNTSFSGYDIPVVEGHGYITYTIPYLPLLEGLYYFSVAVTNQNDTEMYDYHDRAYPFRVINYIGVREKYGLMTLRGEWQHVPGG